MTVSATQPARGTGGRHAEGQGYGLGLSAIDQMFFLPAYPF